MDERIEKAKRILNQGLRSQLLRGDRTLQQCWLISLNCIERALEELNQIEEEVADAGD
jgi:hypothetical protein